LQDMSSAALPLPKRIWWPWDQPAARVAFQQSFTVNVQSPAILYLAASGPYQVWLDNYQLRTPTNPLPSWRSMHQIRLILTEGEHRLSIDAAPGDHRPYPACPFLLACLDWEEGGYPVRVATGDDWRMAGDPPANWATSSSATPEWAARWTENKPAVLPTWQLAWAFDGVWAEPWGMPCNAPADFGRLNHGRQTISPERLTRLVALRQGLTTAGASASTGVGGALSLRPPLPFAAGVPRLGNARPRLEWYRTRETHSQIINNWLDMFEARVPQAIYDAGAETFAQVQVRLRSGGPAIIAITTGESLGEVDRYARRVTDICELRDGETFLTAPTGLRYVKLQALSASNDKPVLLDAPELRRILHNVAQTGAFMCSDPDLNAIWDLSAHTVHLCMQNEIWDGIKRDQLPWMGDLYTEALAAYHVFGSTNEAVRLARHTLAVLAELGPAPLPPLASQRYPGLNAIWKKSGGDINGIPSYTLWWLAGLADYYRYTGDDSLLLSLASPIDAALDHLASWVGNDGLWGFRDGWDYVDWAPIPADERRIFCHLLACQTLGLGVDLLAAAGRPDPNRRSLHARMVETARQTWWRDGNGSFGVSHHVNAMAVRSGVLLPEEGALLFSRTLEFDPPYSMTYWHRWADLDAAGRVGRVAWGLDYLRRHWGQALQMGMTTLWEAFDPAWMGDDPHAASMVGGEHARYGGYETSLCHGWSAGPAAWLHTAVLGVQPTTPGFSAIRFNPALAGLNWAEGSVPTPHGPVHVRLNRAGERQTAEITLPQGVTIAPSDLSASGWEISVITEQGPD
jgi:hypothetical protein